MSTTLRETLTALYDLQLIDSQIQRQKRAQAALDNGAQANAAATEASNDYKTQLTTLHKTQTELKDSELKLASLEAKLKLYQQKLYQGTSTKELANIEREIAALGRQRSDLDTRILELMESVEELQTSTTVAQGKAEQSEVHARNHVASFRSKYEALTLELTDLARRRTEANANVEDKKLLARYEDIRARSSGVGIAKVIEHSCGGCHMSLPSGLIKSVRDFAELQLCDNCGRILTV